MQKSFTNKSAKNQSQPTESILLGKQPIVDNAEVSLVTHGPTMDWTQLIKNFQVEELLKITPE